MQTTLCISTSRTSAFTSRAVTGKSARRLVRAAAKADKSGPNALTQTGYTAVDNSGKGNIYPTAQKAYIRSSTAEAVAKQGLGGSQGGILLAAVAGVLALATVFVVKQDPVVPLAESYQGDSLTAIAERIEKSL